MKSESDLTKLARWIIPGWVSILSFYTFVIVDIAFSNATTRIAVSAGEFFASLDSFNALLTALLVAAAGVPLGFIIYQLYFFMRWNSPFSRDGLLPPMITGRMNDLSRILLDIDLASHKSTVGWRKDWVEHPLYERDHGYKWRYIELLFAESTGEYDKNSGGVNFYDRHRYLHEVTHTLGASVGAIYFGFLAYFFLLVNLDLIKFSVGGFSVTSLLIILIYMLNRESYERDSIEKNKKNLEFEKNDPIPAFRFSPKLFGRDSWTIHISIVSPGSLFIFSLGLFHLFNNPGLDSTSAGSVVILRAILALLIIMFWVRSKKKSSKAIIRGDKLVLGIAFIIAFSFPFLPSVLQLNIDWPFFSAISIFLIANLIIFKNRRNANDDMLALEYYSLQRYLGSSKDHSSNTEE